jgi:hypothetical protein
MKNLSHPTWIKVKGIPFLLVGLAASTLLVLEHPTWKIALLLALAVWGFCRFYYFAFYVIEKYVDAACKFSGLGSFARWLLQNRPGND